VPLHHAVEERGDRLLVRHVAGDELAADLLRRGGAGLRVEVDDHHLRALGGEPAAGGQADPATAAGDHGHPIPQPVHYFSVLMKTFLTSVNPASASGPSSRPRPDCFIPPNGVQYRTDEWELTLSVPVSTARAIRSARPTSRVQIEPDSPYGVSLGSRTASSSAANGSTDTTGPKISSRQCRSAPSRAS